MLYIPYWFPRETYKWVRYVYANDVKELTLKYSSNLRKNLPECLFTCSGLTQLTLIQCTLLSLPTSFKGFPCLIYLYLEARYGLDKTCVDANVLETLISKCPKLEILRLVISENGCLTIHAPKLKKLFVSGYLDSLRLKGTTALNTLGLAIDLAFGRNEIFNCFANIENLVLIGSFGVEFIIQYMCTKTIPKEFGQLRTLNLECIQLNSYNMSFVLNLLTSSSLLERLSINAKENTKVIDDHSLQIECCYILECLRYAQLLDISGSSGKLQLLKYILAHSPVLEEMTIELSTNLRTKEKFKFATEAMRYRRASPNAEIIIKAE
uniref:FBD domain-containing protein n=1 Tax=Chenopodium quinoa TaxID=63459 RepID=A0A803KVD7_CHEQI